MREDLFLIAAETKDAHCLEALLGPLKSRFHRTKAFDFFEDIACNSGATLKEFANSDFPVAVISSTPMVGFLSLVRPRDSFLCIGIEHGIAPFKRYTYDEDLLSSDFYLAPSEGWADRLRRLHPISEAKVKVGGFPKIELLRERLRRRQSAVGKIKSLLQPGAAAGSRESVLVVLSWGVDEAALSALPDVDFVDYLLHPADIKLARKVSFANARLHVSRPEITYKLVANASLVIGDFSSLALECIHLGKHVVFMIDRSLYATSCDMDSAFFDRNGAECGLIPGSESRIDLAQSITADDFASLVRSYGPNTGKYKDNTPRARFAGSFLPPDTDNRRLCVEEIARLVSAEAPGRATDAATKQAAADAVDAMCFVSGSFEAILGRRVDHSGFRHYMHRIFDADQSGVETAISVWREIASSPEAKRRLNPAMKELPHLCFA